MVGSRTFYPIKYGISIMLEIRGCKLFNKGWKVVKIWLKF